MVVRCPRRGAKNTDVEVSLAEHARDERSPRGCNGPVTEIAELLRDAYDIESPVAMPRVGKWRCGRCMLALLAILTAGVVLTPSCAILARHLHRRLGLWSTIEAVSSAHICSMSGDICALEAADEVGAELLDEHGGRTPLFGFLYGQVANASVDMMSEILRGAHVEITDLNMTSYIFLASLPGAYARRSSHKSDAPTMGMHLRGHLNTILFGTLGHRTWLQFEGADEKTHPMEHTLDFWEYKITWRNIGPLGTSGFTERTPLQVDEIKTVDAACRSACTGSMEAPAVVPSGVDPHEIHA